MALYTQKRAVLECPRFVINLNHTVVVYVLVMYLTTSHYLSRNVVEAFHLARA